MLAPHKSTIYNRILYAYLGESMKANKYYTKKDKIYITDKISINSNQCTDVAIKFPVDGGIIVHAILRMIIDEPDFNRKMIEKEIRLQLYYDGERFCDRVGYLGEDYSDEEIEKAIKIANKFFPDFMGVPNSIKFMKGLA